MITPELKKAFNHVKGHFPTTSIVIIDKTGRWQYMDENFESFDFKGKDIDVGILEQGADSVNITPFIYQELPES